MTDYKVMLGAVEAALEICRESSGFMDSMHRQICDDLTRARERLRQLIGFEGLKP